MSQTSRSHVDIQEATAEFMICDYSRIPLAHEFERLGQIVLQIGIVRTKPDGFSKMADGLVLLTGLKQYSAQAALGVGVGRVELNGLLIFVDGLTNVALPGQRGRKVIVDCAIIWLYTNGRVPSTSHAAPKPLLSNGNGQWPEEQVDPFIRLDTPVG